MRFYAVPPFVFTFIYLGLALFYLLLYQKSLRRSGEQLVFSILTVALAGYSFCCFRLYFSQDTVQGRFWLVMQFAFAIPAVPLLVHFFWTHLQAPSSRRTWEVAYAGAAVLVILDLTTPLFWSREPLVKTFAFGQAQVTYFEVKSGPVGSVFFVATIAALGLILVRMRGAPPEIRARLGPVRWGYGVLASCILNDIFVAMGVYKSLYLLEYGYFAFAIGMAAILLGHHAELTNDLERAVEERARELRRLGEALAHSERLAATGLLAATLSHEVANPLAVILSSLDILEGEVASAEGREVLAASRLQIRRIAGITRDLLSLARPQPGPGEPLDLNAVAADFLTFYRHRLDKAAIEVVTAFDLACPLVDGQPGLVQQILLNLVKNAAEALPAGGRIWIRTAPADGEARIEVEDTGPGIDPDRLPRIFEPFFSTKGGKGNGLGLFITQGIVDSMGGRIEVENPPGKGATFRVFLPVSRANRAA